jgi:hypothetical protein
MRKWLKWLQAQKELYNRKKTVKKTCYSADYLLLSNLPLEINSAFGSGFCKTGIYRLIFFRKFQGRNP